MHFGRCGQWLLAGDDFQNVIGLDRPTLRQKTAQGVIDEFQSFVLGRVQQLEVLLDGRLLRRVPEQLIVGDAEMGRGVHVIDVLVVDERAWLADQRVDHVAEVDVLLAVAELSRHPLMAFVAIPQFQMVLVNADLDLQAHILAADGIGISLHADDAVGLHRHEDRSAGAPPLRRQRAESRDFLTKVFLARGVAAVDELTYEGQVVFRTGEVAAATKSQRLVQGILQVTMRRLHVSVLMRLADVDAMALDAIMREQVAVRRGELFVVG